jgi:hypothetical protein
MRSKKNNSRKKSNKLKLVKITKSPKKDKKLMAIFTKDGKEIVRHFGAKGYSDYTQHKDPERMKRYSNRHKSRENWKDPTTPGALSKYVLWNKPSLKASISDYKKKFNL